VVVERGGGTRSIQNPKLVSILLESHDLRTAANSPHTKYLLLLPATLQSL